MSILLRAAEHTHEGSNWEQYLDLMTSVPHIAMELTLEAITGLFLYPAIRWVGKRAIRKHDAEHHAGEHGA